MSKKKTVPCRVIDLLIKYYKGKSYTLKHFFSLHLYLLSNYPCSVITIELFVLNANPIDRIRKSRYKFWYSVNLCYQGQYLNTNFH
jgi:hypothetical protein